MAERSVGLVLSGGGAKCAAHLGAWQACLEAGLRPVHIVSVSMGAVVSAVLAAGVGPDEFLVRLGQVGRGGVVPDADAATSGLAARALFRGDALRRAIEGAVPARCFEELKVPLTVPVVDLDTGGVILYGAGGLDAPLIDVLCATCALPVYFPPVILQGRRCGDGGLAGVLPLEAAAGLTADMVLAVDVGPGIEAAPLPEAPSTPPLIRAHDDAMSALMAAATAAQLALWRADGRRPPLAYARPPVERYTTFRLDLVEQYAAAGYHAARQALDSAV